MRLRNAIENKHILQILSQKNKKVDLTGDFNAF